MEPSVVQCGSNLQPKDDPYTSRVAVIAPTERPKSVRNRCVIEVLVAFSVVILPF